MSCLVESRTSGAARRPWPFGPPLRGRASRSTAGAQPTARSDAPSPCGYQAAAPVGGLPSDHRSGSVC